MVNFPNGGGGSSAGPPFEFAEALPGAVVVWDEKGRLLYANAVAERLLGRCREDMLGLSYDDPVWRRAAKDGKAFPNDSLPVAGVLKGKKFAGTVEYALHRPDGRTVVVSSAASRFGSFVFELLADVTEQTRALAVAEDARRYAESIVDTVREPLIILDEGLHVVSANRSFYETFKVTPEETKGRLVYDLGERQWDIPKLKTLLERILPERSAFENFEVTHDFPMLGWRTMLLNAREIRGRAGRKRLILLAVEDITAEKRAEELERAYEVERRIADALQERLIRPVPEIRGFDTGVAYASSFEAARVGGDYYDVFELETGVVTAVVGDISGKGIEVAGVAEIVRSSIRAVAHLNPSPSYVLEQVNRILLDQIGDGEFATAALVNFDRRSKTISYSSAGHPPIFVCDDLCEAVSISHNLPLGVFAERYGETSLRIEDRLIVLYTDGLVEARKDAELYGEERLAREIASLKGKSSQSIADGLLSSAKAFARGKLKDDIAIVVIRFK